VFKGGDLGCFEFLEDPHHETKSGKMIKDYVKRNQKFKTPTLERMCEQISDVSEHTRTPLEERLSLN
jgi:hypothetical protein